MRPGGLPTQPGRPRRRPDLTLPMPQRDVPSSLAVPLPPPSSSGPLAGPTPPSAASPPPLGAAGHRMPEFRGFISCCLQKNPAKRLSAAQLLQHPFVAAPQPLPLAAPPS